MFFLFLHTLSSPLAGIHCVVMVLVLAVFVALSV